MNNITCRPIAKVLQLGARIIALDIISSSPIDNLTISDISLFIKSKNTNNQWHNILLSSLERIDPLHFLLHLNIDEYSLDTKLLHFDNVKFCHKKIDINIKLVINEKIKDRITNINILPIKCLQLDKFSQSIYNQISYSFYKPRNIQKKHPLIICLHGAGEGGNNQSNILADRLAINFVDETNQILFNSPYILAPQCPTFWLDKFTINNLIYEGEKNYTIDLFALIKHILLSHPHIDKDRIYVIGSSMGGYQALELLAYQPTLFAGGIISCSAKIPSINILNKLTKMPLWFIHSSLDPLVPVKNTQKILDYLQQHHHPNCNVTYYSHVVIQNKEISPHCVFLYVYENQPKNESYSIYEWLQSQRGVNYVNH